MGGEKKKKNFYHGGGGRLQASSLHPMPKFLPNCLEATLEPQIELPKVRKKFLKITCYLDVYGMKIFNKFNAIVMM